MIRVSVQHDWAFNEFFTAATNYGLHDDGTANPRGLAFSDTFTCPYKALADLTDKMIHPRCDIVPF